VTVCLFWRSPVVLAIGIFELFYHSVWKNKPIFSTIWPCSKSENRKTFALLILVSWRKKSIVKLNLSIKKVNHIGSRYNKSRSNSYSILRIQFYRTWRCSNDNIQQCRFRHFLRPLHSRGKLGDCATPRLSHHRSWRYDHFQAPVHHR